MFIENGGDPAKKEEEKQPMFDDNGDLIEKDEATDGGEDEDTAGEAADGETTEDEDAEDGEPSGEDDPESDGETDADSDADAKGGENPGEKDSDDEESDGEGTGDAEMDAPSGEDELTALKKEFERFKAQTKATMKAIGNDNVETFEDLQKLAADVEGISAEDYRNRSLETDEVEEAKAFIKRGRIEKMLADDLDAIKKVYPTMGDVKSIKELPNFKRFGELRDKGVPAAEAFAASHGEMIAKRAVEASKRQSLNGTKDHLRSDAGKKAKGEEIQMTEKELDFYRELLPGKTDKEIRDYYKRVYK